MTFHGRIPVPAPLERAIATVAGLSRATATPSEPSVGIAGPDRNGTLYVTGTYKWLTIEVPFYINPNSVWLTGSEAIDSLATAAAAWTLQSRANIRYVYAGTTSGSSVGANGKSEVFFRNDTNGYPAETYIWADYYTGLTDFDIVFHEGHYPLFSRFETCSRGLHLEDLAVHEFGHGLGLGHSSVADATMYANLTLYCDTTWRTLAPDDIAGIEKMYPPGAGSGTPTNTAPSVSITSPGNNWVYADGATIAFSGSASDQQQGDLSGSLRWTSNLVGQIGTGASLWRTLPIGIHALTASVTDSGGLVGAQQLTVTVIASAPPHRRRHHRRRRRHPQRRRCHQHRRRCHLHRLASRLRPHRPRRPQASHQLPPICKARQSGVT